MLVLTRRIGEKMWIAGNIRVTVVAVKGNRVRLGITAPSSVPVARLEQLTKRAEEPPGDSSGGPVPGRYGEGEAKMLGAFG